MPVCDCTKVPFKPNPPCFGICVGKLLGHATFSELTSLFGFPKDVSQRVVDFPRSGKPVWLVQYFQEFPEDVSTIRDAFENVEQVKLGHFWQQRQVTAQTLKEKAAQAEQVLKLSELFGRRKI
jgi:hypothetical protein